jgi:aminopeptidase N
MGKITDEIDGIVVNVYFLPGGERGAEWVMEVSLRTLEVFNRIFGDYPYAELDIAQTEIAAGGVEYPGIVVVDRNLWDNGSPTTELITAHEVGHQWWYAMVGNNQGEVPWIDESITSYAEGIYLRETYEDDEERYTDWLQSQRNSFNFFLGSGAENLTMNRSTIEFPPFQVGILIYTKGRIFYSELEEMVGRDVFYQALNNYFLDMKYEITSAYDIMRHFEEASGQDLDAFFYEWVGDFEGLDPAVKDDADRGDDLSTEEETLPIFEFGG